MFKKLLQRFANRTTFPIEVGEVADALVALGCQDKFIFSPEEMDTGRLRGTFYQYTWRPRPYAEPELHTIIVYSSTDSLVWQRVISCKELIHVCDVPAAKTSTLEEISALIEKLLGPVSTEDYGLADVMASVDRLALYQALAVLFPLSLREVALASMRASPETCTAEVIAEWAKLPVGLARLVLSDQWPEIAAILGEA